jgi:hypothetical protein
MRAVAVTFTQEGETQGAPWLDVRARSNKHMQRSAQSRSHIVISVLRCAPADMTVRPTLENIKRLEAVDEEAKKGRVQEAQLKTGAV